MVLRVCDVAVIVVLMILSLEDIRNKTISIGWLVAAGFIAAVQRLYMLAEDTADVEETTILVIVVGVVFIVLMVLMCTVMKSMGTGDMCLLLIIGLGKGMVTAVIVYMAASMLLAVAGGVMMIMKRITRRTQMPFVPYISVAYITVFCMKVVFG